MSDEQLDRADDEFYNKNIWQGPKRTLAAIAMATQKKLRSPSQRSGKQEKREKRDGYAADFYDGMVALPWLGPGHQPQKPNPAPKPRPRPPAPQAPPRPGSHGQQYMGSQAPARPHSMPQSMQLSRPAPKIKPWSRPAPQYSKQRVAPAAYMMKNTARKETARSIGKRGDSELVSGSAFLGSVDVISNQKAGDNIFTATISPEAIGNTVLRSYAQMYLNWKPVSIEIVYTASCGSGTDGAIQCYFVMDPDDPTTTGIDSLRQAFNTTGHSGSSVWQPTIRTRMPRTNAMYWTEPSDSDERITAAATYRLIAAVDFGATPKNLGTVSVNYKIMFYNRHAHTAIAQQMGNLKGTTFVATAAAPISAITRDTAASANIGFLYSIGVFSAFSLNDYGGTFGANIGDYYQVVVAVKAASATSIGIDVSGRACVLYAPYTYGAPTTGTTAISTWVIQTTGNNPSFAITSNGVAWTEMRMQVFRHGSTVPLTNPAPKLDIDYLAARLDELEAKVSEEDEQDDVVVVTRNKGKIASPSSFGAYTH